MAISQKLHTKLVQKLILTPSLQQAIKLLPMSTLELSELLNQEMVENPMLEEVPTEDLQPADVVHHQVGDDDVEVAVVQALDGGIAVRGFVHFVSCLRQAAGKPAAQGIVVICNEYPRHDVASLLEPARRR